MPFKEAQSLGHRAQKMNRKAQSTRNKVWHFLALRFLLLTLCYSLFALCSQPSAGIEDRVVAFLDNTAITLSELEVTYAASQRVTPGITREEVLNTMINRILLLREAKKIRLEAPSEDELLEEYIDLKIRPFITIKEEELYDFYQRHVEDFQDKEFETVREEIGNYLTERKVNRLLKIHINELRENAYIKIQLGQE